MVKPEKSQWDSLPAEKRALIEKRLQGARRSAPPQGPTPRTDQSTLPMSSAQTRLWFLSEYEGQSGTLNEIRVLRLYGQLDVHSLQRSLNDIIRRHEVLRANFTRIDGVPVQTIRPVLSIHVQTIDLTATPQPEREDALRLLATAAGNSPFDLQADPLLRAYLYRLEAQTHVMCLVVHSIVCDGLSVAVLYRELAAHYSAYAQGVKPDLSPLTIQYADYAVWQHSEIGGEHLQKPLTYWKKELADLEPLELPADRPRPLIQTHHGSDLGLAIAEPLTHALKQFARAHHSTLYMVLLSAFQSLLYRYTGQEDIAVGTMVGNRTHAQVEPLIGYFVNLLVMRARLTTAMTFSELLQEVRVTALAALDHQALPFERLIEELQPTRDASRAPLVQTLFTLKNAPPEPFEMAGVHAVPDAIHTSTAAFDLAIEIFDHGDHLSGWLIYNTDLFDRSTVERLREHLCQLLEAAISQPTRPISQLSLLSDAERRTILHTWAASEVLPVPDTLIRLFEDQAQRKPDELALISESEHLTYTALNNRANQIAAALINCGIHQGDLVGICLPRSTDAVASVLAVHKAGAAFLMLDPTDPPPRIHTMLDVSQPKLILTTTALASALPAASGQCFYLDAEAESLNALPTANPEIHISVDDIAYHIYTSGSSGQPKGIAIPHRQPGIGNHWLASAYPIASNEIACLRANLSFQDFVWELFTSLPYGLPAAVLSDDEAGDPRQLVYALRRARVTRLLLIPSFLDVLLGLFPDLGEQLPDLRFWVISGENAPGRLAEKFRAAVPDGRLFNLYGTSEISDISWYEVGVENVSILPVGRPIPNVRVYLVDRHLNPVPVGATGELLVSTEGMPHGYLNNPSQTAERFIDTPADAAVGGIRLYRTGDLARWRADGTIQLLGRLDRQVKIRGFRIELDGVEAALNAYPQVQQCAVIHRNDEAGNHLIAYVVGKAESALTADSVREFLKDSLPAYMIPAYIVLLDMLPLTPSGKVDRRALPAPSEITRSDQPAAPRTEIEQILVEIWESLLEFKPIGIRDDFFALGGHSLLAARVMAQIEMRLGKVLPLAVLFEQATIEHLADVISRNERPHAWASLVPIQPAGKKPPFYCVHGIRGNVVQMRTLAQALGHDQPFYGLQAKGLDGQEEPFTRIEDMAAHYIEQIRAHQPTGPYYLSGYSYGGKIVFEMAQQLQSMSEEVGLLALFDSRMVGRIGEDDEADDNNSKGRLISRWLRIPHYLIDLALHLVRVSSPERGTLVRASVTYALDTLMKRSRKQAGPARQGRPLSAYSAKVRAANREAWQHYKTIRYPGRITFFLTSVTKSGILRPNNTRHLDWAKVAGGGIDVIRVPGTHGTMLNARHVDVLARQLSARLQQAYLRDQRS
jgi:amino acid adenylation domain-containing protein